MRNSHNQSSARNTLMPFIQRELCGENRNIHERQPWADTKDAASGVHNSTCQPDHILILLWLLMLKKIPEACKTHNLENNSYLTSVTYNLKAQPTA